MEHFPRALAVARGDEGGMGVYETLLLKEAVDRVGRNRPYPEHRVKGVCPGTQMGDGAQKFEGMALLLQRIIRRGRALDLDGGGVQLTGLLGLGGEDQFAFHAQGGTDVLVGDLFEIRESVPLGDYLKVALATAVVEFDKREGFGFAQGPHPSAYGERLTREGLGIGVNRCDFVTFHG